MAETEIRFAGYGGQGIIRCGIIVGKAASIYDDKFATMNQSFGPEARGGACSSQLIVSDEKVLYPYVANSDILVAMSQEGYDKFVSELKPGGLLLYDEDLVKLGNPSEKYKLYPIPATRFAEELGARIIANVVMMGFFTALTTAVTVESMKKSIPESVPSRYIELNLRAFKRGYQYGQDKSKT